MSEVGARDVEIPGGPVALSGTLSMPSEGAPVVVFAHGSGSSRQSPRNVWVAGALHQAGLGTLLFDLLTPIEADDRANVFDIPLLASRLATATRWVREEAGATGAIGYFGASTGASAALWAAADLGPSIGAVVSRGGRPDLAEPRLSAVSSPTLLIVGGEDREVLALNRESRRALCCENDLAVVPGAGHLFEEAGALEEVSRLATAWFTRHLRGASE
jgi:putative phosphoribosyl transferase